MQSVQENIIVDLILQHTRRIQLEEGLKGFEDINEFDLKINPVEAPLIWLKAVHFPEVTFIAIDPFLVFPDYQPEFNDDDIDALKIESVDDMFVLCITNVSKHSEQGMTANLVAPLLINWVTGMGKQVVIKNHEAYSMDQRLLPINLAEEAA